MYLRVSNPIYYRSVTKRMPIEIHFDTWVNILTLI